MTEQLKMQIADALETYIAKYNLTQSEVAEKSGVNASYIIQVRKKDFTIKSGDKRVSIADKYFKRLADFIGFATEKDYWPMRATPQSVSIFTVLKQAKEEAHTAVITGATGCGKSYICKLFAKQNPLDVFIVTVGSSDNLSDLIDKVLIALNISPIVRSKSARLMQIAKIMRSMAENGLEPTLIFDEAEYMKQPALCALKELIDALSTWCALVLIGTSQLTDNIEKLRKKNRAGIPQLYRRIKYRIRPLPAIDTSFKEFLNGLETDAKRWLQKNCDNYGELHDALLPALKEGDRTGNKLDEIFIKQVLGIQ